jgi:hypothetical protein
VLDEQHRLAAVAEPPQAYAEFGALDGELVASGTADSLSKDGALLAASYLGGAGANGAAS